MNETGNQLNVTIGLGWVETNSVKYWHLDLYFENGEMRFLDITDSEAESLIECGLEPFNG